jgi:hypothetical protein
MFIPLGLFLFVFYIYLRTVCATFNINDSGETIMVCDLLTISHSPGYPLHTLWGRLNCLLPLGKPMFRVTFCSLLTGSVSVALLYSLLKMMFQEFLGATEGQSNGERAPQGAWVYVVPSLFGALIFAFSYQHWFQACGAKGGIYTLNTFLSVFMLYLFFKMRQKGWFIKSFLLMGFLYGLSLAHHWPNQIVMAPAFLFFLIAGQKRIQFEELFGWLRSKIYWAILPIVFFLVFCVSYAIKSDSFNDCLYAGVFVGVIVCLIASFRVLGPLFLLFSFLGGGLGYLMTHETIVGGGIIVFAIITGILNKIFGLASTLKSYTMGILSLSVYEYLSIRSTQHPLVNWWNPDNWERLVGTVVRKGYQGIGDVRSWTTVARNLKRFWFHAGDQFGTWFTVLVFLLALVGLIWLFMRNKTSALGVGLFGFGVLFGVVVFNNPLEGYQWTLDNFFSPVFMMFSIFAAAAVAWFCDWAARNWKVEGVSLYVGAFCLGLSLLPLQLNYPVNDQSRYVSSYDEGMNMLKTVNRTGVILCNGDIDILPLWYLQYVEGKRSEVVSFTMQLIPYDWYRNPLMARWPFLAVPMRKLPQIDPMTGKIVVDRQGNIIYTNNDDIRPETVVQDMINQHGSERSFYYTNIYTAQWMRDKNPLALPDGFLWRISNTLDLGYPFTSARMNELWSTYRLRNIEPEDRGYWDEYTDVMKDSYGIGHDFSGYYAYMHGMYDLALWCFDNALKYRQPQTLSRIYLMQGETRLALGDYTNAVNSYQECLKREPRNPYAWAKMGDAFRLMNDSSDAEQAYRTSLSVSDPQHPTQEAVNGLQLLAHAPVLGPGASR